MKEGMVQRTSMKEKYMDEMSRAGITKILNNTNEHTILNSKGVSINIKNDILEPSKVLDTKFSI